MLEFLYRFALKARHFAYDQGIFKSYSVKPKVISVGNIALGGSGKTPFIRLLAQILSAKGKVAILSRGYRGQNEKSNQSLEVTPETPYELCGDEPLWLKLKLPQVIVIVGKDRVKSAKLAEELGAQIILLDDGMQHRRLKRDLELVLVRPEDLTGHLLPWGRLRDLPERLEKADLLIFSGTPQDFLGRPATSFTVHPVNGSELSGKRVAAFCAIARPDRFFETLKTLNVEIVSRDTLPDHRPFSRERLEKLAKTKGIDCLVCTEKDAIKIPKDLKLSLPIIPLAIELEMQENFQQYIEEIL